MLIQAARQSAYHVATLMAKGQGATEASIERAIADGHVIRTHVFRGTWQYVAPEDVRWMLDRTFYPDNSYTRDREGNPIRPYDMSTDTFGEFMGVRSDPVGENVTADLVKLTGAPFLNGCAVPKVETKRPARGRPFDIAWSKAKISILR